MRHASLVTVLLLAGAAGVAAAAESSPPADTYGPLSLYAEAMGIVHQHYLAPESVAGHRGQPIAVLVNHGTESAAEVLAGALQDWGRAVIVGTATFGDASAQALISLPGERTLELTTVRYLTPKGRAITGKGIVPDVPATPAERASLDASLAAATPGSPDPEVQLAFEMVKAARIVLRER
jgi:C-terminal processing protease CtpA/Prc